MCALSTTSGGVEGVCRNPLQQRHQKTEAREDVMAIDRLRRVAAPSTAWTKFGHPVALPLFPERRDPRTLYRGPAAVR